MAERVSSLDAGYQSGDLSLFPTVVDDRTSLYDVRNNAKTTLKYGLPHNGNRIIVEDASSFPSTGLIRVGPEYGEGNYELIYYGSRSTNYFTDLIRGFSGSIQTTWSSGAFVINAVMAEHHNAVKDALLKIENYLGTKDSPDSASLNGIIKSLESRFLSPQAKFQAFPKHGPPLLKVRFQDISSGQIIRYLWDFGDGTYSIDQNPSHTYATEGFYTVQLMIITSTGKQGVTVKSNYIMVSEKDRSPFFYTATESSTIYSITTATRLGYDPTVVSLVDQTDGDISRRIWVFGDGTQYEAEDPDEHTTTHSYQSPGEYKPTLIVVYSDQTIARAFEQETLTVL